ncbi:hypothetical protein OKW42_002111 [Paraburkholderia sp. WC7.3d]
MTRLFSIRQVIPRRIFLPTLSIALDQSVITQLVRIDDFDLRITQFQRGKFIR